MRTNLIVFDFDFLKNASKQSADKITNQWPRLERF
jgi:hypothetical protein